MYKVFGIAIADVGLRGAADLIQAALALPGQQLVVTANPEILVYAHRHPSYRKAIEWASLVVPDGFGVVAASYLSPNPVIHGRVTGVDLVELLVKESQVKGYSIYFVGTESENILQKATQYFAYKYGKINISGINSGPYFSASDTLPLASQENKQLINDIALKKPDIVLVGFGHPKQELWLSHYLPQLPVKVGIGVGGIFDYFAGVAVRAPKPFQKLGLEWLWRLVKQPRRLKRIITAVFVFPYLLAVELIRNLFHMEQK